MYLLITLNNQEFISKSIITLNENEYETFSICHLKIGRRAEAERQARVWAGAGAWLGAPDASGALTSQIHQAPSDPPHLKHTYTHTRLNPFLLYKRERERERERVGVRKH